MSDPNPTDQIIADFFESADKTASDDAAGIALMATVKVARDFAGEGRYTQTAMAIRSLASAVDEFMPEIEATLEDQTRAAS